MQKVIYSVTRLARPENVKSKGIGYVSGEYLITACLSKQNKPYVKSYPCIKDCHPVPNAKNEFKGTYYEFVEVEVEKKGSYETIEIEVDYYIWYKYID